MPRLPVVPDVGTYVREQRVAAQLSLRQLAQRAGMSNPYLSQIERGLRKPSAEILSALADALDLSAETLYVRAGILDEVPRDTTVVAAIGADPHLTEAQKRSLVDLYRLFVDAPASREGLPHAAAAPQTHVADEPVVGDEPHLVPLPTGVEAAAEHPGGTPETPAGTPPHPGDVPDKPEDPSGDHAPPPANVIALPTAGPEPTEPHHPEETP